MYNPNIESEITFDKALKFFQKAANTNDDALKAEMASIYLLYVKNQKEEQEVAKLFLKLITRGFFATKVTDEIFVVEEIYYDVNAETIKVCYHPYVKGKTSIPDESYISFEEALLHATISYLKK